MNNEIIKYAITSFVLDKTGRCLLPELVQELDINEIRKLVFEQIPRVISENTYFFPLTGIVKKSGSYAYVSLPDNNNYITALLPLLNLVEETYGIEELVPKNYPLLNQKNKISVISPPSPIGSHVTIGNNFSPSWLNKKVDFLIDLSLPLVTYGDSKRGLTPSSFDHRVYPIRWYVLYVKGLPQELLYNYHDRPHISVGMLAYVK